ncbi:putative RING-H2 finger protein ATL21A [Abeliophyllum distichum]|uniref:RING-H2 finger protein ATL21A n=1 Tax=Abeliophyllum distichum TaxID=126358 RepID=A0ABD1TEZ6_9LAMI
MGILKVVFFVFLKFLVINARNDCKTQFCGNNSFEVRFPFQLQGERLQNCGYSTDFVLDCSNWRNKAVLNIPYSGNFLVRSIDYLKQEIQIYDPDDCLPGRLMDLNLSSSPFMADYYQNYTFFSCPSDIAKSRFTTINCLSNSTISVLATSSMNLARAMNMCSIIVTLPIPVSWPFQNQKFSSDLNDDLKLTWNVPDCVDCEEKSGICGFENSTSREIQCFPDPGTGKSRGLQIFKIIALSMVIPAITCSFLISCFMCLMDRRHRANAAARNTATATVTPQSAAAAAAGLDDSTIESYTKVVIGESRRLPGPNGVTCPICLVDYNPKDTLRCIPQCEHCFHSECIDEWLRMNGQQLQNCEYINLKCSNKGIAILKLPYSEEFYIQNIYYDAQIIQIYDPSNCLPKRLLNLNLSSSPLRAIEYQKYTFYSCQPELLGSEFKIIDCLSNSTSATVATSFEPPELMEGVYKCKTVFTSTIPVSWLGQLDYWGTDSNLHLAWNDLICNDCEEGTDGSRSKLSKVIAIALSIPGILIMSTFCCLASCVQLFRIVKKKYELSGTTSPGVAPPQATMFPGILQPQGTTAVPIGLDDSKIQSCTELVVLNEGQSISGSESNACPICLEGFHPKETVRCISVCKHCFHANCIEQWLRKNSTCPVCRTSSLTDDLEQVREY